ncbi:unnamed protein product [Paramecium sonneborni]|uniref:Uncharacterized protein n=1 Tax=Paramecium sonneborni TaxID=65129 RepID=A0A8S1RUR1_9CILI|nr:unnamed protein product [Paramecium sonneborni]
MNEQQKQNQRQDAEQILIESLNKLILFSYLTNLVNWCNFFQLLKGRDLPIINQRTQYLIKQEEFQRNKVEWVNHLTLGKLDLTKM